jgi:outer membrane protein TolC
MRRFMYRAGTLLITAAVILSVSSGSARAEHQDKGETLLSLDDCIKLAVQKSAEVGEAEYDVDIYRAKKDQADAGRYPQVDVIAYGSLSPRARLVNGDTVESSTNINKETYDGVFGRATVQLIQPLYTFGKISGYRDAASHGILAYEAGAKLKATDVALQVKQAYYGLLLAREIKLFLRDIKDQLDKATAKVQRQLDAGAPNVDQVDLFKLQTYQSDLMRYMAQAEEGEQKALFGLQVLIGREDGGVDIKDEYLIPADVNLGDFNSYVQDAMKDRLEFTQLSEGLKARESLIKVELADYYPQVFMLAFGSVAGATNRDHLNNPYIFDEFNHTAFGAVVGFKWSIDLGMNAGQVREARAQYLKLKMKEDYARTGVPYQVKEAYLQLERSQKEMKALMDAYKSAKQWVITSLANFDLGVGEARDIADSVSTYARIRADYFRSVYNQRLAIANLQHATGMDADTVPYTPAKTDESDAPL